MSPVNFEKLEEMTAKKRVLILTHNNPDPDAIAAGWALSHLLKKKFQARPVLAYGGILARAENRAMVRLLGIKMEPIGALALKDFTVFALVDTQPRTGNNSLPSSAKAAIVIDHHGARKYTQKVEYADLRIGFGSSSTILTEYLTEARVSISKKMATALFFGLKTDTQNLGRHATEADYRTAIALYPKVQLKLLSRIENPDLPLHYFIDFDKGLHAAKIFGNVIFCDLGFLANTDMVSLMADFLLRLSGVQRSLVIGTDDSSLIFSLRTKQSNQNAGQIARRMVKGLGTAGGHRRTAGGQIPIGKSSLKAQEKIGQLVRKRFLYIVGQGKARERKLLPL
jgi:nanoRNase/pAp phosphatase (c-di-AMP/oligoRNAs hydrolase)